MPQLKSENTRAFWSPATRLVLGLLCAAAVLGLLGGAATIPFAYETSSILYKFGLDRALLRTGKILGLLAAVLLLLQLVLSARLGLLDRIFGLNRLYGIHRINGIALGGCALVHPVLIFIPENMLFIPFTLRYWPEFVGSFLLLLLVVMVVSSNFRRVLGISFEPWWLSHRIMAVAATAALLVHVLFVSASFESGPPRALALGAVTGWVLLYIRLKAKGMLQRRKPWLVEAVERVGQDIYRLVIKPQSGRPLRYAPGQFAFIRMASPRIAGEEHPFTLASSPTNPAGLEFVIQARGDWTGRIAGVRPGDRVFVDGPYGIFSYLRCRQSREIVMIAGGIGITPMLSMLRHLAATGDKREITLIWSNRNRGQAILPELFQELSARLPGLRINQVFTGEPAQGGGAGRLDRAGLERLLADFSREAMIFLCGPTSMVAELKKELVRIGFPRRRIFTEIFSL